MTVTIIVAIGNNREIGLDNKLLWHIPDDLKRFRKITMGHHVVMGRRTFESIGKPLPGRKNIVLTRREDFNVPDMIKSSGLKEALAMAKADSENEVFIIGGESVYRKALELADRLYLTKVDYSGSADRFFPEYQQFDWKIVERKMCTADAVADGMPASWEYIVLERK